MKVYEMTIADIASEIFDKGEDFAEKIFNDIDELEKNKLLEITQLKQQLAEKDKEINSLIVDYEKRISQEQELMSNMEHLLTEKQNAIDEINKEFVQAIHDWKTLCAEKDKEIEKLNTIKNNAIECADLFKVALSIRQKDLAIQELEKVKDYICDCTYIKEPDYTNVRCKIDHQIKELKGEK